MPSPSSFGLLPWLLAMEGMTYRWLAHTTRALLDNTTSGSLSPPRSSLAELVPRVCPFRHLLHSVSGFFTPFMSYLPEAPRPTAANVD